MNIKKIESEGAEAYRKGVPLEQCPYIGIDIEAASIWMHSYNVESDYWEPDTKKPPIGD